MYFTLWHWNLVAKIDKLVKYFKYILCFYREILKKFKCISFFQFFILVPFHFSFESFLPLVRLGILVERNPKPPSPDQARHVSFDLKVKCFYRYLLKWSLTDQGTFTFRSFVINPSSNARVVVSVRRHLGDLSIMPCHASPSLKTPITKRLFQKGKSPFVKIDERIEL